MPLETQGPARVTPPTRAADPGLFGRFFVPFALASALLAAAPLVPRLTPGWPRGGTTLVPLALAGAFLFVALVRVASGARPRMRDLLVVGAFPLSALYTANGLFLASADNVATRRIASQLVTRGTFDLAHSPPYEEPLGWAAVTIRGRLLPAFPVGVGLLQVPYAAVALAGSRGSITPPLVARWEKHFAALLTVASVVIFFLAVTRSFGRRVALGSSGVLALASSLPACAAQSMWSLTGELFCTSLALWLLMPGKDARKSPVAAGAAMAGAFLCRPTALLSLFVLGVLAWREGRREAARYGLTAAAGIAAIMVWQLRVFGHALGAYGLIDTAEGTWGGSIPSSFAGTLLSPSRGLLVWHPWLLLLPFAAMKVHSRPLREWWRGALAVLFLTWLVASLFTRWWGGGCLGPRYFTGVAPFLALLTAPLWTSTSKRMRAALVAAVAFASTTQLLAAYNPKVADWSYVVNVDDHPRVLWSIRDSQLAAAWWPGWRISDAYASTLPRIPGRQDETLLGSVDEPREGATVIGPLRMKGWARVPGEDLDVRLFLDGAVVATPIRRVPRPELQAAIPSLGDCSRAGWESVIDRPPRDGSSNVHELTAVFFARDGRVRSYPVRHVTWKPAP
ncbi:MAG TPA: hypothetical protein VLJ18_00330 [Thermoanaerobaculia bacterium]|nr:hypothetical protein [Thermoanaerobaculia bacterium]